MTDSTNNDGPQVKEGPEESSGVDTSEARVTTEHPQVRVVGDANGGRVEPTSTPGDEFVEANKASGSEPTPGVAVNLLDPPAELVESDGPVDEQYDLRDITEDELARLEAIAEDEEARKPNPFAIQVSVTEIFAWRTQANERKAGIVRSLRAAQAIQNIFAATVQDLKVEKKGKEKLEEAAKLLREAKQQEELGNLKAAQGILGELRGLLDGESKESSTTKLSSDENTSASGERIALESGDDVEKTKKA